MTERNRRALLVGAGIVIGAWLLLRGGPGIRTAWRENRERVQAQRQLLAETRRAIEDLPRMEDSARALTRRITELAPRLLTGSSAPVAQSDLSSRLSTIVGLAHGRVLRIGEVSDTAVAGPLRRATVQLEFETDLRGVGEVLDYLGRGQLAIVAERLQITALDPTASPAIAEQLNIVLRVSAWFLTVERGA